MCFRLVPYGLVPNSVTLDDFDRRHSPNFQFHEPTRATTDLVIEALLLQGLVCGTVCR